MQEQLIDMDIPLTILKDMYVTMLRIRKFEETVADFVSKKEIVNPCHLYIGEEAVAAGICSTLRRNDYVFSTHRSHGHYIAKGGSIKTLMAELYCRVAGCSKGKGGSMHIASPDIGLPGSSAIVAGTIPIAVGAALAFSLQRRDSVSVTFFGDGGTNEGVFYESLNLAALKKLPVIFVCENNLYSTHMPISACLANTDICKKAEAFSVPAIQVDGNDVIEVFKVANKAIENARHCMGPTLIECMTYRWRGHVGSSYDINEGLRSKEELEYWMDKCPIKRLEAFMKKNNLLSESEKIKIHDNIRKEIEEAIVFKDKSLYPDKSELFNGVFRRD